MENASHGGIVGGRPIRTTPVVHRATGVTRSPNFSEHRQHRAAGLTSLSGDEIIPRIPQPYRTSFSAIAPPMRLPRSDQSAMASSGFCVSSPPNLIGGRKRTTSPGRIVPFLCCNPELEKVNKYNQADALDASVCASTRNRITMKPSAQKCTNHKVLDNGASVGGSSSIVIATIPVVGESIYSEAISPEDVGNDCMQVDHVDGMVEKMNTVKEEHARVEILRHSSILDRFRIRKASQTKDSKMINCKPLVENVEKGAEQEPKKSLERSTQLSIPVSSSSSNGNRERSKTLPSKAVLLTDGPGPLEHGQKSVSMSITSFFRKMSPKSLRRFTFMSDRGLQQRSSRAGHHAGAPVSSSHEDVIGATEIGGQSLKPNEASATAAAMSLSPGSLRSLKKSPKLSPMRRLFSIGSRPGRDAACCGRPNVADSEITMSCRGAQSTEIAVSQNSESVSVSQSHCLPVSSPVDGIDIHRDDDKSSPGQTHKEKQSPKKFDSHLVLKPQILCTVEFPDNILQGDRDASAVELYPLPHTSLSLPRRLGKEVDISKEATLPKASDVTEFNPPYDVSHQASSSSRFLHAGNPCSRKFEPPTSLNIRVVHKLNRHVFQFPSMSLESIGQCSLDATADTGLYTLSHILICFHSTSHLNTVNILSQ